MRAAIALAWLLCLTHVIAIAASKIEVTSKAVRQSVVKALPLLARTGPTTFKKSGCVSCHNQSLPAVAMAMARERGLTVEEEAVREILRTSVAAFGLDAETRLQMGEVLGRTITIGYALLGLAAENHRPDKATDSMALWTARTQFADGSWHDSDHRPPMEYSRFTATALGLRSLQLYGPPTRREEFEGRVELARDWLVRHQPRDTEGRTFLLLGLAWAGAPEKAIRQAADDLIESQRPDGGWAQLVSLESDAYATGQALYALHTAGRVPVRHKAYQRGAAYLLEKQLDDGSWRVSTRSFPFQSYFEGGFPHGPDQWISAAATSWATMALTLTVRAQPESE